MPVPATDTPGVRRPAGVSRLGVAVASLASAGSFAFALVGLGGPPAPPIPATASTVDAAGSQAPVQTIYVQLPAPSAAPVVAAPKTHATVVTRQSGSKGTEGGEQEGND